MSGPSTTRERKMELEPEGQMECRLCGGPTAFALTAEERQFGLEGRFDYDRCAACQSLQLRRIPPDLSRFYPRDYYASSGSGEGKGAVAAPAWRRAWTDWRLRDGPARAWFSGRRYARFDWFRRAGIGRDDAILDVGCGNGRLLRNLARDGFTNLVGIDPGWQGECDPGPGLRFARATAESWNEAHRLVMAHHSFEHVPEPAATFAALVDRLAPGGCLLLRVPLADSWAADHYGADWVQLDAPRHLHLPTRRAISMLAARFGLRVLGVREDSGPFQIRGSERRVHEGLGRNGLGLPGWNALDARLRARALRRAGRGDQACFWMVRD